MQRISTNCVIAICLAILLNALLASCGHSRWQDGAVSVWKVTDPDNDVRLTHPEHPDINGGTFELTSFELLESDTHLIARAVFSSPVRAIRNVRLSEDRRGTIYPQTVDIYIDSSPEVGAMEALPDRNIHVTASEAWDQVLVMSSIRELNLPGLIYASHLIARGKTLIGVFEKEGVVSPIRGALVLVTASSPRGTGRIRLASTFKGICTDWNQMRCTLLGSGPPVLDATTTITGKRPVRLTYFGTAERPQPKTVPVVFSRGRLVGAAPVPSNRIEPGHIATIFDDAGVAVATAVVLSIVDDTASLEIIGDAEIENAKAVAFQESDS